MNIALVTLMDTIRREKHIVKVIANVCITPAMAAELLKVFNTNNRDIRESRWRLYSKLMKEDRWRYNGDSIRISKTGRMLDGQHRLLAIVDSGKSQNQNIQLGLEDETFDVIDTGKNRTVGDALGVKGMKYASTLGQAIKIVMAYDANALGTFDGGRRQYNRGTNAEVVEWLDAVANADLLQEFVAQGVKASRQGLLSATTYSAFGYIFGRKNKEKATEFITLLSEGSGISKTNNSPIFFLREKLRRKAEHKLGMSVVETYALIIKAWNLWRADEEVKQLALRDKEAFPKAR